MTDAFDDTNSMIPTALDRERITSMKVDGRVEAENGTWVLCRYPAKTGRPTWCEFSLLVNNSELPGRGTPYELRNLQALYGFMKQLDSERKRS